MMYILNIPSSIKKMIIKELTDFITENYYRQMKYERKKDSLLLATKLKEKLPDATNA